MAIVLLSRDHALSFTNSSLKLSMSKRQSHPVRVNLIRVKRQPDETELHCCNNHLVPCLQGQKQTSNSTAHGRRNKQCEGRRELAIGAWAGETRLTNDPLATAKGKADQGCGVKGYDHAEGTHPEHTHTRFPPLRGAF